MKTRAKMVLTAITEHAHWGGKTFRFETRYDDSIPEDQRFYDATPSGHVEMTVNNPAVIENVKLGDTFYVDFIKVE